MSAPWEASLMCIAATMRNSPVLDALDELKRLRRVVDSQSKEIEAALLLRHEEHARREAIGAEMRLLVEEMRRVLGLMREAGARESARFEAEVALLDVLNRWGTT